MPTARKATPRATVRTLLERVLAEPEVLSRLPPDELDLAMRTARRARLLGYLGRHFDACRTKSGLPQTVIDQFDAAQAMVDARARMARWELDRIAWAMGDDDETPLILLKGSAYLLLGLPNAAGRMFADVDLLVREADLARVESRLRQHGWQSHDMSSHDEKFYRDWTHEVPALVHGEREIEVDVHFGILPRRARLQPSPDALIASARPVPGSRYYVLSEADIVLHAMAHLMFSGDLADSLRELVDIHLLLEFFGAGDAAFWTHLTRRAAHLDLRRPAWYSLRYARHMLGTTIPRSTLEAARDWAPNRATRIAMDGLVPRALYPPHPDSADRWSGFCRWLLLVRLNWIRLPPHLLVYHLSYKWLVRATRRVAEID